jgi:hypothetical protein
MYYEQVKPKYVPNLFRTIPDDRAEVAPLVRDLVDGGESRLLARVADADWSSRRRLLKPAEGEVLEARRRAALVGAAEVYLSVLKKRSIQKM